MHETGNRHNDSVSSDSTNSMILSIGDNNPAGTVYGDVTRAADSRLISRPAITGEAMLARSSHCRNRAVELYPADAAVLSVSDEDAAKSVNCDFRWKVECGTRRGAAIACEANLARTCNRRDCAIEANPADTMVENIGYNDSSEAIYYDTRRPESCADRRSSVTREPRPT